MNEATIIAMICTSGTEDFLRNALLGLAAAGIDSRIVYVARPDNAGEAIDPVLRSAGAHGISFTMFCDPPPASMPQRYAHYGSPDFVAINWMKVRYLRWLLRQHRHVVYADVDVAWLGDPLWYLQSVARHYPLAFQTEGVRQFPPRIVLGICLDQGHGCVAKAAGYDARSARQGAVGERGAGRAGRVQCHRCGRSIVDLADLCVA